MHFTTASASLHCIKHHLKKAASQSTRSTHHRDRLSHEELAASGWRQALQLGEAMIVPPVVVSNISNTNAKVLDCLLACDEADVRKGSNSG